MFKVSLVLVLGLLCNGCASSSASHSLVSKVSKPTQKVDNRLVKYATTQGCKMLKSGYMVCPKVMNR